MNKASKIILSVSAIACSAFLFAGCSENVSANDVPVNDEPAKDVPATDVSANDISKEQDENLSQDSSEIETPCDSIPVNPVTTDTVSADTNSYAEELPDDPNVNLRILENKTSFKYTVSNRTADFSFKGDTLVIRWRDMRPAMDCGPDCYGTADGIQFVGGKSDKLEGEWTMLPTYLSSSYGTKETITVNNMRGATYTIKSISEGVYNLSIKESDPVDMANSDDLMNSTFMYAFYEFAYKSINEPKSNFRTPAPTELLQKSQYDINSPIERYGIEVTEKTNTSETFVVSGKTVTIVVEEANVYPLGHHKYSSYPYSFVEEKLSFAVTSNDKTCSFKLGENSNYINNRNAFYNCLENLF